MVEGLSGGKAILLVEDNPDDAFFVKRAFEKAEIVNPLMVVSRGEDAMAYLEGDGDYGNRERYPMPVLMLLDLKLPGVSGFEVLEFEWLRGQSRIGRLPVVVLTSSNQTPDIYRAYEKGANSYLVKPVSFDELIQMVKTLGMYWLILNRLPRVD